MYARLAKFEARYAEQSILCLLQAANQRSEIDPEYIDAEGDLDVAMDGTTPHVPVNLPIGQKDDMGTIQPFQMFDVAPSPEKEFNLLMATTNQGSPRSIILGQRDERGNLPSQAGEFLKNMADRLVSRATSRDSIES